MTIETNIQHHVKYFYFKNSSKKRKRTSLQEQLEQESLERYNKLVHQARKALHKQGKTVKQFESLKVARRLKQSHSRRDEETLARIKAFSIHHVEETCLQRLGIFNLNPQPDKSSINKTPLSQEDEALLEKMLSHKKMVQAMDAWNDKVTEYRQWLLQRRERISAPPDFANKKKNTKNNKIKSKNDTPTSDLFVCLGGGTTTTTNSGEELDASLYYGPSSSAPNDNNDEYAAIVKKPNRPGQRARKAKAMAIQAKKEGRPYVSVNWREKKPTNTTKNHTTAESAPAQKEQTTRQAAEIASMGKSWKEDGKEHPSWAASQAQKKTAIVAFQGTKITFD